MGATSTYVADQILVLDMECRLAMMQRDRSVLFKRRERVAHQWQERVMPL